MVAAHHATVEQPPKPLASVSPISASGRRILTPWIRYTRLGVWTYIAVAGVYPRLFHLPSLCRMGAFPCMIYYRKRLPPAVHSYHRLQFSVFSAPDFFRWGSARICLTAYNKPLPPIPDDVCFRKARAGFLQPSVVIRTPPLGTM